MQKTQLRPSGQYFSDNFLLTSFLLNKCIIISFVRHLLICALHDLHPFLEAFFNAIIVPLMIYEMIPENSRSAVSIASFLVYFSTYVIILQENIRTIAFYFSLQIKSVLKGKFLTFPIASN